jgi:hypothetical protein
MPTLKSVRIRSYQVGFGDCFLLSFEYSKTDLRHVLIDFGTTELPPRGKERKAANPAQYMPLVAQSIADACKRGRLVAVVATHRHADHISGFATDNKTGKSGDIIRRLKPALVIQPWTEDPRAKRDAKTATADSARSPKRLVAGLNAMHHVAGLVLEIARRRPGWMSAEIAKELRFLGEDNLKNVSAVKNLIAMGQARGATAVWAHHGSPSGFTSRNLPGVKATVLGPPNLKQSEKIRTMRAKDPDEFWHLLGADEGPRAVNRFDPSVRSRKRRAGSKPPIEGRWFSDRLDRLRGQQLLEIVRTLDDQMNNTSVILLFEVFGKKLLFPGDAQIENWSYALQDAPDAKQTRKRLSTVDFYKVGHHGSLNATPRRLLWENFRKRKDRQLQTMVSTLSGKHGKMRNHTEVPRATLIAALEKESCLLNTEDLPFGAKPTLFHEITIRRR